MNNTSFLSKQTLTKYKTEILIFLIVFIVYSFFTFLKIANHLPVASLAADQYFQIANNLANHSIFSLDGLSPTALRMPGYPFFLSILFKIFHNWWAILLIQNIISGLSAILLYQLAKIWLTPKLSLITTFIWALEPYSIDISSQFLTETLYIFFILIITFIFIFYKEKINNYFFLSIIATISAILIYIRPSSIFLPICFLIPLNLSLLREKLFKKIIIQSSLFLLIIVIFLSPWFLRNYQIFKIWQLSSDNTSSIYITALTFQKITKENDVSPKIDNQEMQKFLQSGEVKNSDQNIPKLKTAIKIILNKPFDFLKFYTKYSIKGLYSSSWWGSARNLIKGSSGEINYHKEVLNTVSQFNIPQILNFSPKEIGALIIMISGALFWGITFILFLTGEFLLLQKTKKLKDYQYFIWINIIIIYIMLLGNLAIDVSGGGDIIRYRFIASPFIIMLAIYAISNLRSIINPPQKKLNSF